MSDRIVADRMEEAEPEIIRITNRHADKMFGMPADVEDMRQFIRLEIWKLAKRFDEEKGDDWIKAVRIQATCRVKDFYRIYGNNPEREGRGKRRIQYSGFANRSCDAGNTSQIDYEDPQGGDEANDVDWLDLVQRCKREHTAVLALVLRANGLTNLQIGKQLGVCESRVSQQVCAGTKYQWARDRLCQLLGETA